MSREYIDSVDGMKNIQHIIDEIEITKRTGVPLHSDIYSQIMNGNSSFFDIIKFWREDFAIYLPKTFNDDVLALKCLSAVDSKLGLTAEELARRMENEEAADFLAMLHEKASEKLLEKLEELPEKVEQIQQKSTKTIAEAMLEAYYKEGKILNTSSEGREKLANECFGFAIQYGYLIDSQDYSEVLSAAEADAYAAKAVRDFVQHNILQEGGHLASDTEGGGAAAAAASAAAAADASPSPASASSRAEEESRQDDLQFAGSLLLMEPEETVMLRLRVEEQTEMPELSGDATEEQT